MVMVKNEAATVEEVLLNDCRSSSILGGRSGGSAGIRKWNHGIM